MHSVKNLDNPKASWGIMQGNPVWEEIIEAASMSPSTFLLNVTLNRDKQITRVFAGDLEQAYKQGCTFVKKNSMVPIKEPYDIVITSNSGYPLDLSLYQSIKGISAASQIVKKGGSIIVAADCWDGIPDHGKYGGLLLDADSPENLLETIRTPGFSMQDMWQAQIHALISQKADVYFYSENLSDEQIIGALLKPCHSIEATVNKLVHKYGPEASICVLLEGPQTIPYICNAY
ncbi:MAG: nickel-dependent lactate racemase family protein [Planctomycetota bacterium]|jgi:nickel-dependent lactate racemase